MDIGVVFEDQDLLVVDKPPNLVVTPAETSSEQTLADILTAKFKINLDRGGIVHRLDKDTSGLLLVAKNLDTLEKLQSQFKERLVKKEYLALVHGFVDREGFVEASVGRNPQNREKFIVIGEGKDAYTGYKPVQKYQLSDLEIELIYPDYSKIQLKKLTRMNYQNFTLLKCLPQTGRTHQIRVHLKYINHPIISDDRYSGRKINRLDKRWCPRQFLHAASLSFTHPKSKKRVEFECPLPQDLLDALKHLNPIV